MFFFKTGERVALVMTPTFMGSEPPVAKTGRFAGTAILEAELQAGLALVRSLEADQRSQAILSGDKTTNNNRGELFQDNAVVPYEGLRFDRLNAEQGELAHSLVALYINNLRKDQAQPRMAEIEQYWAETYFTWVGETEADSVFYYRIHNPVVLIEFDHQLPVALDVAQRCAGTGGHLRNQRFRRTVADDPRLDRAAADSDSHANRRRRDLDAKRIGCPVDSAGRRRIVVPDPDNTGCRFRFAGHRLDSFRYRAVDWRCHVAWPPSNRDAVRA